MELNRAHLDDLIKKTVNTNASNGLNVSLPKNTDKAVQITKDLHAPVSFELPIIIEQKPGLKRENKKNPIFFQKAQKRHPVSNLLDFANNFKYSLFLFGMASSNSNTRLQKLPLLACSLIYQVISPL